MRHRGGAPPLGMVGPGEALSPQWVVVAGKASIQPPLKRRAQFGMTTPAQGFGAACAGVKTIPLDFTDLRCANTDCPSAIFVGVQTNNITFAEPDL